MGGMCSQDNTVSDRMYEGNNNHLRSGASPSAVQAQPAVDLDQQVTVWEAADKMPELKSEIQLALDKQAKPRDWRKLLKLEDSAVRQDFILKTPSGDHYKGHCLENKPHGWGYLVTSNGEYFEGEFRKGTLVKYIRHICSKGTLYDGEYKIGRNGKGICYNSDGLVVKCSQWGNGIPQIPFIEEKPEGNVVFKGFRDIRNLNQGRCFVANPKFNIEATDKDGLIIGPITKLYPDGSRYDGAVDANLLEEGQGILTFPDGRKFAGPFSKGKPHGKGKFTTDNGEVVGQEWVQGKRV